MHWGISLMHWGTLLLWNTPYARMISPTQIMISRTQIMVSPCTVHLPVHDGDIMICVGVHTRYMGRYHPVDEVRCTELVWLADIL